MPNTNKQPRELKELADEVLDSIDEDPEMEPGQADTTPVVPPKVHPHPAEPKK
jgi:hypothetical protein